MGSFQTQIQSFALPWGFRHHPERAYLDQLPRLCLVQVMAFPLMCQNLMASLLALTAAMNSIAQETERREC